MVEVFDIQKNIREGTDIIKKKYKDGKGTKGVATIQLFDKDGLVQETISNNFITNPIEKRHLYGILSKWLGGSDASNNAYISTLEGEARFGQIQLRNGDFEENPKERYIKGELVGWCPRTSTDAGNNIKRGTYSPTESYTEYTEDGYYHCHLVYDFATTQANGTFNHIYWNYQGITDYPVRRTSLWSSPYWYRPHSYGISADIYIDAFGDIVVKSSNLYYKVENTKHLLNGVSTTPKYDLNSPIEFVDSKYAIDDDMYIKVESSYTSGKTVESRTCNISINLYNKQHELVKQKNIDLFSLDGFSRMSEGFSTTNNGYVRYDSLKFVGRDGKIYFSVYAHSGSSNNKVLPWFNSTGNLVENNSYYQTYLLAYDIINDNWIFNPNPYEEIKTTYASKLGNGNGEFCYTNYCIEGNKYMVYQSKHITQYDLNNWAFETQIYNSSSGDGFCDRGVNFKTGLMLGNYGGYVSSRYILPYTAHTKLPNPVTKTSTTTMKITYDYYIQLPNLHCEVEGEEFNWE